jgi:hypothetical protein
MKNETIKVSSGRTQEKRRWRYKWEAREAVVATQGLFGMRSDRKDKKEKQASKGVEEGAKVTRRYKRGVLGTCEEGVFKVLKKIELGEGGREKRLWVGYVFGGGYT